MKEWNQYQKITKGNTPKLLATNLKRYLNKKMSIVDIGCGAGTDSMYFIQQGLFVTAIDKETSAIEHIKLKLDDDIKCKLNIINADFTNLEFPICDAIYASFSLPFCTPNEFNKLWVNIEQSLKTKGIFAGIFFGVNDDWYKTANDLTFHSRCELEKIFDKYTIKEFNENEYDGYCVGEQGDKVKKHWHIYEIIAIKND